MGKILLGIQRIGYLSHIIVFLAPPAATIIAAEEEVLVEVGGGFQAQSRAPSVHIVMTENRIDRTDINVVGRTGLYGILEERLQGEDHILHALHILNTLDKTVHATFALRQFHLSVLIPELIVAHLCICLRHLLGHTLEEFLGNGVEAIVCQTGGTRDGS